MCSRAIYVEIEIRADLERVWGATQNPHAHPRWDVRFSSITPTGNDEDSGAQKFRYERATWFRTIRGTGVSLGEVSRSDGSRTSALKFATLDRLSPIRSGRGYWRYLPTERGVRFITGYDYVPGWGFLDVFVRPIIGWATAWSFDRLRIWLEDGVAPERSGLASVLHVWRPERPRAARCKRAPEKSSRRGVRLDDAPETLQTLPEPGASASPTEGAT